METGLKISAEDCPEAFGDVLLEVRKKYPQGGKILTQGELALDIPVAKNYVGYWEVDAEKPAVEKRLPADANIVKAIADRLHCSDKDRMRLLQAYACDALQGVIKRLGF